MEYAKFLIPFHPSPFFYQPPYVPIRPQNEEIRRFCGRRCGCGGVMNSSDSLHFQERKKGRIIRWTFPSPGYLKLNTDGSSLGNPGPASYGGLIRDESGKWVCGYMGKLGFESSLTSELWGISKGLSLIKEMGLKKVLIETDCMAAFLLISVQEIDEKHPHKSMIEECRLVMKTNNCLMMNSSDSLHFQERKKGRIIRWTFPSPGYLKLNTDGSSLGNPGPASYGGLIRDESGKWVCGYMGKLGFESSLTSELWGISKGLSLIKEMGLKKVLIETDCMAAFLLISVQEIDEKHPHKSMIEECRLVMKTNNCLMIHTVREGNHCADKIAKLGGQQGEEYSFLQNPPHIVVPFLLADLSGVGFERPIR